MRCPRPGLLAKLLGTADELSLLDTRRARSATSLRDAGHLPNYAVDRPSRLAPIPHSPEWPLDALVLVPDCFGNQHHTAQTSATATTTTY